jgi:5'-3' exonuclease
MKVIFDADSLIYASCFKKKEDRESAEDIFETDINVAFDKFSSNFGKLLAFLEDLVPVDEIVFCNGSKNNFRKDISPTYKLNRTQKRPEILLTLHERVKFHYDSVYGDGVETDDVVATLWAEEVLNNGVDSVIIMSIDKDYKQFPCWFYDYNYKKRELVKISREEALNNFYSQMIVGDTADNINYCKGYGKSYAKKLFQEANSEYSLVSRTYRLYKEIYGDEAKSMFNEAKSLLTLKTDCYENIKR